MNRPFNKNNNFRGKRDLHKINNFISAAEVRVILDDGEQFPCTCALLERVGLTRSSNGHVCCKWSEFPEDFCPVNTRRMSVLSRVMPSPTRVHSELKRFVIRAVSRIGSVDVQKWLHHVEEWTDY